MTGLTNVDSRATRIRPIDMKPMKAMTNVRRPNLRFREMVGRGAASGSRDLSVSCPVDVVECGVVGGIDCVTAVSIWLVPTSGSGAGPGLDVDSVIEEGEGGDERRRVVFNHETTFMLPTRVCHVVAPTKAR